MTAFPNFDLFCLIHAASHFEGQAYVTSTQRIPNVKGVVEMRKVASQTKLRVKWLENVMWLSLPQGSKEEGRENVAYPGINRCDQFSDKKREWQEEAEKKTTDYGAIHE